jgi:hypothetical protein
MAFTKIAAAGIGSTGTFLFDNLNVTGVSTFGNTVVGGATTELIVSGDARVTGILTIGTSSITLDGSNNQVNVGTGVTIHHSNGVQVGRNTLHSEGLIVNSLNASGVITATSFYGDGTNLTNTGSTLSAASGSQRVVLTGQTSGTMTASATSSSLSFNASTGALSATSFSGSGANLTGIAATTNVRTDSLVVSGITTATGGVQGNVIGNLTGNVNASGVSTFSGGVVVAAGSAGAPSISPTGDNNTGIFFPAADTIGFSNGGSEKWRIGGSTYEYTNLTNYGTNFDDYKPCLSSYRSSGGSSSTETFDSTIGNGSWNSKTLTYNQIIQTSHGYAPAVTNRAVIGSYVYASNNGSGDNSFPTGGSGTSYWTPNGCAIWGNSGGASGNQGTASIRADFQSYYYSGSAFYARVLNGVTSGVGYGLHVDLGGHPFGGRQVGVYVRQMDNQTMTGNAGYVYKRHNTSNTFWVMQVENGAGSTIGGITCTNTNTAFPTSSDYRLKENVVPLTGAIDKVKQIPVHRFNFIASPEITQDGFLAHELQPIVPIAVDGDKDEVETLPKKDEDGNFIYNGEGDERTPIFKTVPKYQTVDYSKVVPLLTAALQEALTEIETLKARLDAAGL